MKTFFKTLSVAFCFGLALHASQAFAQAFISPADLKDARFYPKDFVASVEQGRFDPFTYWQSEPVSLYFSKPGNVEIHFGEQTLFCKIKKLPLTTRLTFEVQCDGATKLANWTWVDAVTTKTNLVQTLSGISTGSEETFVRLDDSIAELTARFDDAFAQQSWIAAAGWYEDDNGNKLKILPQGQIFYNDTLAHAKIQDCLMTNLPSPTSKKLPRGFCLAFPENQDLQGLAAITKNGKTVLKQGFFPEEKFKYGRLFELKKGGSRFHSVPALDSTTQKNSTP